MHAFPVQEPPEGEAGCDALGLKERVHRGMDAVTVGGVIQDEHIFQIDGVHGLDAQPPDGEFSVEAAAEALDGFMGQGCLDTGRLDGHQASQQHHQQCRQDDSRYAQALFHRLIPAIYKDRIFSAQLIPSRAEETMPPA